MQTINNVLHSWGTALETYKKPKIFLFLLLGFACGIPYGLLAKSLAVCLTVLSGDVGKIAVLTSVIMLPYSLRFLWAPVVDHVVIPGLTRLWGQKRAWGLVFQIGLLVSIYALAAQLGTVAEDFSFALCFWAFMVAFFSASQDIVVDALRIDTLAVKELGEGAGSYQVGYRLGILLSGAGTLFLASHFSWVNAYLIVGFSIIIGMIGLKFLHENHVPVVKKQNLKTMVIDPVHDFVHRHYYWGLLLSFIVLYRLSNTMIGAVAGPFYVEIGFSPKTIASVSGVYGVFITLLGAVLGGSLVMRWGIAKALWYLGIIEVLTSIAFGLLAATGPSIPLFSLVITFDNIIGGMGNAAFVAFLSALCSKKYSASQYALLASVFSLTKLMGAPSGYMAADLGWPLFFILTGVLMVPSLILLHKIRQKGF